MGPVRYPYRDRQPKSPQWVATVARDVIEIALDALRRQAAGLIGVHHDRDVTVLEPEGPGAVPRHAWSPETARAGIPQARAEIMSGGPSAVLRPFAGAGRPCAFSTAPPETRRGDSEMVLRAGPTDRRQSRLRAPGAA
jgi:hypothetical protein